MLLRLKQRGMLGGLVAAAALLLGGSTALESCQPQPPPPTTGFGITNATCLSCHDGRSAQDKREFLHGAHGAISCQDCHGDGYLHVRNAGRWGLHIDNPARRAFFPSMRECSECHAQEHAGFLETAHAKLEAASCHECHDIHRPNAMRAGTAPPHRLPKETYAQLCSQCHDVQVSDFMLSTHAQLDVATCASCHDVHRPTALTRPAVNNNVCLQCHASFQLGFVNDTIVDFHTGPMHPVDPAGTGASRCIGCHMPPISQGTGRIPTDHTLFTVPPLFTNEEAARGVFPPPPNSCAGVAGCHDPGAPGSGRTHDPNDFSNNERLQRIYNNIGFIP